MTGTQARKIAFVLAASEHGTLIINRFDYHMTSASSGFGVGFDILNTSSFDRPGVDFAAGLLPLLRRYRGDGVVAIDCGANLGVFTIEWARTMAGWGQVIAIEAQERIFYALAGNIAINNCFNARAIFAAASDKPGTIKVPAIDYSKPASFGSVEIKPRTNPEDIGQSLTYTSSDSTDVACMTLDSLTLPRVDLIKIDVEGMELDVLAGSIGLIRDHHPVLIVEFIKSDKGKLTRWLDSQGYGVFEFGLNFVAVHKTDKIIDHIKATS